jgi:Sap, sulfolipid-1-addressing protein
VIVALQTPHPARVLACFLAGGLLTCVTVGTLIVLRLQDTSFVSGSRPPADPILYLGGGLAALGVAELVRRRAPPPEPQPGEEKSGRPSFYERALRKGAPLAFVAGVVLNILPGVFPLVALKDVAELDWSATQTAAVLAGFYLIMFTLIVAPLVSFLAAPSWTATTTVAFNEWLRANTRRLVVMVLRVVGVYLLFRGILALI